jgi:DHA1 family bicyclomycin/chloramphenicol resistance-like MFS transporter
LLKWLQCDSLPGPAADRYGRRLTYWLCAGGFLATTLVCIFAPTIGVLVAFRALQGCTVTGYMVAGEGWDA